MFECTNHIALTLSCCYNLEAAHVHFDRQLHFIKRTEVNRKMFTFFVIYYTVPKNWFTKFLTKFLQESSYIKGQGGMSFRNCLVLSCKLSKVLRTPEDPFVL